MSSKASFTIAYDGQSLREGRMDVKELAPALLAIGQLFDAANHALNGDDSKVNVEVRATSHGSFAIDLELIQSVTDKMVTFLSGEEITAAINLKELLLVGVGTTGSLIWLVRHLKNRKPERLEKIDEAHVKITIEGKSTIIPLKLLRLYQDLGVRGALKEVVFNPLQNDGVDEFKVIEGKVVAATVSKDEAEDFIAPELPETVILDERRRAAFSIISLAFKEDNKWRLHDGNNQINALITDETFLRKVDTNSISFAKGDILVCEVHVLQTQTQSGLKTEYTVEKVVEHREAARQLPLEFDVPDEITDSEPDNRVQIRLDD